MNPLFIDTSGWGHLLNKSESLHRRALDIYRETRRADRPVITTNYVIIELVALLTSPFRTRRPYLVEFIDGIRNAPFVRIVHVDPDLHEEAWRFLVRRLDKDWSFVDCVSFVLMRRLDITDALTSDEHFEQAGFIRLLKE